MYNCILMWLVEKLGASSGFSSDIFMEMNSKEFINVLILQQHLTEHCYYHSLLFSHDGQDA